MAQTTTLRIGIIYAAIISNKLFVFRRGKKDEKTELSEVCLVRPLRGLEKPFFCCFDFGLDLWGRGGLHFPLDIIFALV
jgi:hypothetical protein